MTGPRTEHKHDFSHRVTVKREGNMIVTTRYCSCGASETEYETV